MKRHKNLGQMSLGQNKVAAAVALATLPSMMPLTVQAQDSEAVGLEEIVVTASRRSESLQDVPINIAAVNAEQIEDLRLTGINEIARYVPGLTVIDRGPRDENPDLFVRGLNTSGLGPGFSSDTVATYFSEIPLQADIFPVDLEPVSYTHLTLPTIYSV